MRLAAHLSAIAAARRNVRFNTQTCDLNAADRV